MTDQEIRNILKWLVRMTPEQEREQVISFAYGNLAASTRHRVTKDDIRRAVAELESKP